MEQGDGRQPQSCRRNITTLRIWHRVMSSLAERPRSVLRVGDVWIPKLVVSPNHFVRLYILVWKIFFRLEILYSGWNIVDQAFAS